MDVPTRRKRIFGIRKPYDALFTFKVLKKAQITTPATPSHRAEL